MYSTIYIYLEHKTEKNTNSKWKVFFPSRSPSFARSFAPSRIWSACSLNLVCLIRCILEVHFFFIQELVMCVYVARCIQAKSTNLRPSTIKPLKLHVQVYQANAEVMCSVDDGVHNTLHYGTELWLCDDSLCQKTIITHWPDFMRYTRITLRKLINLMNWYWNFIEIYL